MNACHGCGSCNQGRSKCRTPLVCEVPESEDIDGLFQPWELIALAFVVAFIAIAVGALV